MYKCISCGIEKSIENFQIVNTVLGHKRQCRQCWSKYMKDYYRKNPKQYKKHKKYVNKNDIVYKRSYSRHHIDKNKFEEMLDKYDGKCYSCKENAATCIDHDHSCCPGNYSCGICIRGILCNWCNSSLGHASDSIERLENLIKYLKNSRQ
jgi:hypothetical protein